MGYATFLIMFFHLWINIFSNVIVLGKVESFIKNVSYYGVDIFFMMSAISMYHSMHKDDDIKHFYKKRRTRLLLPWLVCGIWMAIDSKWSLLTLFKNITGINFFFKSIYSFKWYMIAISLVYLLFPFYYKLFNKIKDKRLFTLVFIVIWTVGFTLGKDVIRNDFYGLIYRIPIFCFGVYLGYLSIYEQEKQINDILLAGLFILGLVIAYCCKDSNLKLLFSNSILAFSSSMLIASHFERKGKGEKLLELLGECSLEMYLFQELVGIKMMNSISFLRLKILINFFVLSSVIIVCFFLHLIFERIKTKIQKSINVI